jgi:hypothetical protein
MSDFIFLVIVLIVLIVPGAFISMALFGGFYVLWLQERRKNNGLENELSLLRKQLDPGWDEDERRWKTYVFLSRQYPTDNDAAIGKRMGLDPSILSRLKGKYEGSGKK